jgi:secondary thiamine-phosphate synthase enzyme
MQEILTIETNGPGLYDFTREVANRIASATGDGLVTLFVRHTSASLLIQENADSRVQDDLNEFFRRIVPYGDDSLMSWLTHTQEGPDDMPAHIKAALTQTSLQIPVSGGRMLLGTWQGIYLFEHRFSRKSRQVVLHLAR